MKFKCIEDCIINKHTVHWHFINLCGIVLLDITEDADVVVLYKVDCHTLTSITT